MATIHRLLVVIEPNDSYGIVYPGRIMHVRVDTDLAQSSNQAGLDMIIPPDDDLHSVWDLIWERAGREIKDRLLEMSNEDPKGSGG